MTSNNNNNKAICVTCKIPLLNLDPNLFKCSKCHNTYNVYYEIMEYEDDFETLHEDEVATIETAGLDASSSGGLESSSSEEGDDMFNLKSIEEQTVIEREQEQQGGSGGEGSIKRPSYMKGSNVIFYQENFHSTSNNTTTTD